MNVAIFSGRIVADPEYRTTQSGVAVTTLRLAVQRRFKDSNGEKVTDFFSCVAWRQTAEYAHKYLNKGDMVIVRGEMQTRSYDAQDGSKRYVTELIVDDIQSCGNTRSGAQDGASETVKEAKKTFGDYVEITDDVLPF